MANDPFVLRHLFEFLVPSQCRCGKDLDKKLVKKAVEEVKTAMGTWFGGFGQTTIRGGWVLETGRLAEETVEVVYSNATTECWHAHRQDFFNLAQEMADRMAQEAIACRINAKLYLIQGNTDCLHVARPAIKPLPVPPPSPEAQRRARLNEMEGALRRLFKKEEGNDPILDLMVHTLNYPHASAPVPVGKWPRELRALLLGKQSPHVIAETASGFKVILIGMENPKLLLMEQRQIIERMLKDNPSLRALFIVTNKEHAQWHFVNVREGISGKRLLLRRFRLLSAYQAIRTVVEQFLRLDLETVGTEASVDTIKAAHDHAFDVQAMTDAFFKRFAEVFTFTKERIIGIEDEEQGHLFAQQLFNRLLFLSFIDKKGWLRFEGPGSYFENLWDDYRKKATAKNKGFYKERLEPLFFETLNRPKDEISQEDARRLEAQVGKAPFLNGGLFERDENDKKKGLQVPDECFPRIFRELFGGFNFTVTESTPFDEDVAIDPEMLGRVFEELVVGRHESGSYYTPKPVVAFMCREALKGHLASRLPRVETAAIEQFVDEYDAALIKPYAEEVLDALRTITVCDPACGSGAYLLGMLHELMHLRGCLFDAAKVDAITAYNRKLEIIHNNIYGVDLEIFAVNIARLRLWLSLVVEYEGDIPPPLPNLDFKIECGDSVLGPRITLRQGDLFEDVDQIENWARGLARQKERFMKQTGSMKEALREAIEKQEQRIQKTLKDSSYQRGDRKPVFFWRVQFFEVFARGGFDIILANPPFVRQEIIRPIKPRLKEVYPETFKSSADLYCYFYVRSVSALRPGGMLVYISSKQWLRADYGAPLRKYLARETDIKSITDFGELPVFQRAATFPMIIVAHKKSEDFSQCKQAKTTFTQVSSLSPPYPDVKRIILNDGFALPAEAFQEEKWTLTNKNTLILMKKMENAGIPLSEYIKTKIYRGVLTGCDEAYKITSSERDRLIKEDPKSAEIIKPLAVGDDIRKWHVRDNQRWIILARIGIDIKKYPAVLRHLKQFKERLETRNDKGEEWWQLRACSYYEIFSGPKIHYPEIAKESRFTFDNGNYVALKTIFTIPTDDLFLLAVLNSDSVWSYLKMRCSVLGDAESGGRLTLQKVFVEKLPIPIADRKTKDRLIILASKCLRKKGVDCRNEEDEINEVVKCLYKL